jgi:hypothetical protein
VIGLQRFAPVGATRHRLRHNAQRLALLVLPLGRPVAWRTRTFLSQPHFDVESRMLTRLDVSDARNSARFDKLIERLGTQDRNISTALRENRKLFGSLRDLLEDQAEEIELLRNDVRVLSARLDDVSPIA